MDWNTIKESKRVIAADMIIKSVLQWPYVVRSDVKVIDNTAILLVGHFKYTNNIEIKIPAYQFLGLSDNQIQELN